MSFSDNCGKKSKEHERESRNGQGLRLAKAGSSLAAASSYVSNEFVHLVAANVVHSYHGVEGCVSDRRVSVADVNCDVLERLGRCRLAYVHPVGFNQAAQLFKAF